MKKIVLLFALTGIMMMNSANAQNIDGGTTGSLTWNVDVVGNDTVLTINGSGAMPDYFWNSFANPPLSQYTDCPWFNHRRNITSIIIGDNVTSIGENAFYSKTSIYHYSNVRLITIGNSLASGCDEFKDGGINSLMSFNVSSSNTVYASEDGVLFDKLKTTLMQYPAGKVETSYTIPNSVTIVGDLAFWNCNNLTSVSIPEGVTDIGKSAFSNCNNLISVTIPNSIVYIGSSAFSNCKSLTSITIPENVTSIGDYAFGDCFNLKTVNYNAINCTSYGTGMFAIDTAFTVLNVGDRVKSIPESFVGWSYTYQESYEGSPPLSVINFSSDSLITIGAGAFHYCSALTSITIPKHVTSIENGAFEQCSSITSIITYANSAPTIGNRTFSGIPSDIPVYIPCGSYNSYSTATGWNSFSNFIIDGTPTPFTTYYTTNCYLPYTDQNFTNINQTGEHSVTLLNSSGCDSLVVLTLVENPIPQLCMVSVDEDNHNEIVWKKENRVNSYNIYREGNINGQYDLIANVPYTEFNNYVDMASNARLRSYRYKVSGVDTCGKESELSTAHKTMHLTINAGQNNSWNLIWTSYEGMSYSTYNIYRSSGSELGNLELIGTMPSGNTSYTDFSAPAGYVYYMVEIMLNEPCVLTKSLSSIKSNIASNKPTVGINEIETESINIYPNPTQNTLHIQSSSTIEQVSIYDISGRTVGADLRVCPKTTTIDVSHLANGIYLIKVKTTAGEVVRKVVKE